MAEWAVFLGYWAALALALLLGSVVLFAVFLFLLGSHLVLIGRQRG